jgi:hypothetical protein
MSEVTGLCAGHQNLGKPKIFALFASEEVGGALSFTKLFFFFSLLIWSERLFTQLRHTDKLGERKSISTRAWRDTGAAAVGDGAGPLLLARRLSLQRVGHEASVGAFGDEGMPWSHSLKAQKAEGLEQGGSVLAVLMESNEDVVSLELLSKFQQNCKTVLTPLG